MDLARSERRLAAAVCTTGGTSLAIGWLLDIDEPFGSVPGALLVLAGTFLIVHGLVLLYWTALRADAGRTALVGTLLAASASIILVGFQLLIVIRATGVPVQELMGSRAFIMLAIVPATLLQTVGWLVTGVAILRSARLSSWTAGPVIAGPLIVVAGSVTRLHAVVAGGFILMGLAMIAVGVQLGRSSAGAAQAAVDDGRRDNRVDDVELAVDRGDPR